MIDNRYLDTIREKVPKLSQRDKSKLDRVFDMEELETNIRQLKPNKCPGEDGFPVEFFRCFWQLLKILLYNVYQEVAQKRNIPLISA